jgi:beta-lactamase class A
MTLFSASKKVLLLALPFAFGIGVGIWGYSNVLSKSSNSYFQEIRGGGQRFTNPLLDCQAGKDYLNSLEPFKNHLTRFLQDVTVKNHLSTMATYFRDLNDGPWFGINASALFSPASLLKVPVMMALFKQAETDPGLLQKKVRYTGDSTKYSYTYPPAKNLVVGQEYTVDELISQMIIYSDNAAKDFLFQYVSDEQIKGVYAQVGVEVPNDLTGTDLDVTSYASFFRILYNASYLGVDMSEKALNLLHQSTFHDGLVAGVPANIVVAHKFGERVAETPGLQIGEKQLHDCGVVYYPKNPYLLCMMTRGSDFSNLSAAIQQVSQAVYQEVDKQNQ